MMTDSSDEEHSADVPDGVSCKHGLHLQDHLYVKKEEEELWESLEVKQEKDITVVTLKSEDEEEEAQCSLLHMRQNVPDGVSCKHGRHLQDHLYVKKEGELWESPEVKQETDITAVTVKSEDEEEEAQWRQSEENIKGVEPATCSSAKLMKVEPNGDMSEGPEAANTDGEETDCSEDWREPLSKSEDQRTPPKGTAHNTEKRFGCNVCGKRFDHRGNMNDHVRIHKKEKPFGCDVCEKKFGRKDLLKNHMRIHSGEKLFDCDLCRKRFGHNVPRKNHTRIHTGDKPFECDVCGKQFTNRGSIYLHRRIHTGGKSFRCDLCGKLFNRQANLKRHARIHTGEKSVSCDVCGKMFWDRASWRSHFRIHSGEKPFGCDVCGEVFRQRNHLTSHMFIHSGEKPHHCGICKVNLRSKRRLVHHMSLHTEVKPLASDVVVKVLIERKDSLFKTE